MLDLFFSYEGKLYRTVVAKGLLRRREPVKSWQGEGKRQQYNPQDCGAALADWERELLTFHSTGLWDVWDSQGTLHRFSQASVAVENQLETTSGF